MNNILVQLIKVLDMEKEALELMKLNNFKNVFDLVESTIIGRIDGYRNAIKIVESEIKKEKKDGK
jgi:hypothetical protein